ncbi:hypothetical protein [Flavobacteriaceae bacterium 14752]|uniref:hypothetical protein n=1 Tax=Mesohalobacter salilacus TaxID=2491711 RepID=UPI000F63F0CB|nr:hypothetical protein EIG84_03255 [Flavobacteriaceae bacterium 14752]
MKTLILFLCLFLSLNLSAQQGKDDDITSYKIAFITERLDLNSKEAQVFWPIYNKHNKRYENLKKNTWEPIKKDLINIDNLSEKEAEQLLVDYRNYKKKRLAYREDYIKELLTVISPKKIMQLKKADYDFNRELLKQYQSK